MLGSENPHVIQQYVRNSPKLNVWCALSPRGSSKIRKTLKLPGHASLICVPADGPPSTFNLLLHWSLAVCEFLNEKNSMTMDWAQLTNFMAPLSVVLLSRAM
jgi:hypothetical protein